MTTKHPSGLAPPPDLACACQHQPIDHRLERDRLGACAQCECTGYYSPTWNPSTWLLQTRDLDAPGGVVSTVEQLGACGRCGHAHAVHTVADDALATVRACSACACDCWLPQERPLTIAQAHAEFVNEYGYTGGPETFAEYVERRGARAPNVITVNVDELDEHGAIGWAKHEGLMRALDRVRTYDAIRLVMTELRITPYGWQYDQDERVITLAIPGGDPFDRVAVAQRMREVLAMLCTVAPGATVRTERM